jgi:hypothetical protein
MHRLYNLTISSILVHCYNITLLQCYSVTVLQYVNCDVGMDIIRLDQRYTMSDVVHGAKGELGLKTTIVPRRSRMAHLQPK